jgi:hypothetical protein
MAERTKVVFMTFPHGEVVAILSRPPEAADPGVYWCYPAVEGPLGGSPAAWSARVSTPEEYAPVKARLDELGCELELCEEMAADLFD